jgi:hypothetical protein
VTIRKIIQIHKNLDPECAEIGHKNLLH